MSCLDIITVWEKYYPWWKKGRNLFRVANSKKTRRNRRRVILRDLSYLHTSPETAKYCLPDPADADDDDNDDDNDDNDDDDVAFLAWRNDGNGKNGRKKLWKYPLISRPKCEKIC